MVIVGRILVPIDLNDLSLPRSRFRCFGSAFILLERRIVNSFLTMYQMHHLCTSLRTALKELEVHHSWMMDVYLVDLRF